MALTSPTCEAQIVELFGDRGDVINVTVADGTTISKGTILRFSAGTKTASKPTSWTGIAAGTTLPVPVAGIAMADKVANDGATTLGAWTNGTAIVKISQNGGLSIGDAIAISGANNTVRKAVAADVVSGAVLGYILQKGADDAEVLARIKVMG